MRTIEKKIAHAGAGALTVPFENQNNGGITITARDVPDNPAAPVGGDLAILAVFEDGTEAAMTTIRLSSEQHKGSVHPGSSDSGQCW